MDFFKERLEAIEAGERALESLYEARKHISAAKGFGIWDILGGGSFVSFFKHYKIDRARKALERARWDIMEFSKELRDLNVDLEIDIGLFATFLDIFNDWLFADIWVQCRLSDIGRNIDDAIDEVENCLDWLEGK